MTKEWTRPKPDDAVTDGSDQNCSAANLSASGHVEQTSVCEESQAIIKEASVRRRTAIEILANR